MFSKKARSDEELREIALDVISIMRTEVEDSGYSLDQVYNKEIPGASPKEANEHFKKLQAVAARQIKSYDLSLREIRRFFKIFIDKMEAADADEHVIIYDNFQTYICLENEEGGSRCR